MKIIFMGTPEFAVTSLEKIYHSNHDIVGIITVPDKPKGRGQKLSFSPVKSFALSHQIYPILQPENLSGPQFISELKNINADIFIVVAFRILPPQIFTIPMFGTINLHSSLLPEYRGAAPINWVIINGEKKTGVTTFFIEKGVDTGKILYQKSTEIKQDETAGELHDRLAQIGSELLLETINQTENGHLHPLPQPVGNFKKAPKLNNETMKIDWNKPANIIKNKIQGLSPSPGAFCIYNNSKIKIYRSQTSNMSDIKPGQIGEIRVIDKNKLYVQTKVGFIEILELQFPGKKRLKAEIFLRGFHFKDGDKFE